MRWGLLITIVCLGCGAATSNTDGQRVSLDPSALFPLKKGNAWSYEIDTGDGEKTLAIHKVILVEAEKVQVSTGGTVQHYHVNSDGIFRPANSAWLLKTPIEVGAKWASASGMVARVKSINANVETDAGKFTDCVEVEESGGDAERRILTIYCPKVGPVYVESQMNVKEKKVKVVGRLKGYQVE